MSDGKEGHKNTDGHCGKRDKNRERLRKGDAQHNSIRLTSQQTAIARYIF